MNFLQSLYKFLSPKYQTLFLEYKVDFRPRFGKEDPHKQLYEIINTNRNIYKEYLEFFLSKKDVFWSIKTADKETNEYEPTWNNGFLPGLDVVALYGLTDVFKPQRYVEIGSGNSTKVVHKAIKDFGLKTTIVSIDPMPRASVDHLADETIRKPIEACDLSFTRELCKNDFLFIDNSHRCFPNSDVTVCFLEILPKLRKGVVVHIHDIYLPYDYPQFMCDRFYSEQYLLACFLLASEQKFNVVMPNFFVSEDSQLSGILNPLWDHPSLHIVERHGGSFWFKIS